MPPSARSRRRARARLLARLDRGGADADVLERPRSVPERRLQRIVEADLELVGPADVDHRIVGVRRHLIALARLHRLLEQADRKSVVSGKSVSVRVDPGGGRIIKKKKQKQNK